MESISSIGSGIAGSVSGIIVSCIVVVIKVVILLLLLLMPCLQHHSHVGEGGLCGGLSVALVQSSLMLSSLFRALLLLLSALQLVSGLWSHCVLETRSP